MELLHSLICLLCLYCRPILTVYIGLSSSNNIQIYNGDIDKSRVPMIRLTNRRTSFLKPSISHYMDLTDNGATSKSGIRALPRKSRKFADIIKQRKSINLDVEGNELDNSSQAGEDEINSNEEREEEIRKGMTSQNEGSCTVDGQNILNSEEIFQNECGTLQCINSEVTWSLKPLAKTLPHCEGTKSIPSMFHSYTKIKVVDEDDDDSQEKLIQGKALRATDLDADITDKRKKIEEASRKMIEAEKWD